MLNLQFEALDPFFKEYTLLLQHFFCTNGYLFELIFALLKFRDGGVRVLEGPFPRSFCGMCKTSNKFKIPFFAIENIFLSIH